MKPNYIKRKVPIVTCEPTVYLKPPTSHAKLWAVILSICLFNDNLATDCSLNGAVLSRWAFIERTTQEN